MRFAFLQEPPFCFTDASGKLGGCDAKLAEKIGQMVELADFSPIEIEFADLLPGVAKGRWDMTTGLFISDERRKLVDFTRPIWALPDGLMVAKGDPLGLAGYRSLARNPSAILAVISDQIQHQTALQNGDSPRTDQNIRNAGGSSGGRGAGCSAGLCQCRHGASRLHRPRTRCSARRRRCSGIREAACRRRLRACQEQCRATSKGGSVPG